MPGENPCIVAQCLTYPHSLHTNRQIRLVHTDHTNSYSNGCRNIVCLMIPKPLHLSLSRSYSVLRTLKSDYVQSTEQIPALHTVLWSHSLLDDYTTQGQEKPNAGVNDWVKMHQHGSPALLAHSGTYVCVLSPFSYHSLPIVINISILSMPESPRGCSRAAFSFYANLLWIIFFNQLGVLWYSHRGFKLKDIGVHLSVYGIGKRSYSISSDTFCPGSAHGVLLSQQAALKIYSIQMFLDHCMKCNSGE